MTGPAIPVIDLAPLYEDGREGLAAVARRIGIACRTTGFFLVGNTRVAPGLRAGAFQAARSLFAAPPEVKREVSIARSPHNRGYVGLGVEALDPAQGPDRKEAFNIGFDLPPDDREILAGKPFRGINLWPRVEGFREAVLGYYDAMLTLGRDLHRAIAVDLGLPADAFDSHLARPNATLRLLRYPAAAPGAAGLGAGEHTDYGNLTLLATDGTAGLEVRLRDGRWCPAPSLADAFVCNIGDCLMRWTNDVYVSTPHRVVIAPGRERYSLAFFLDADPDAVVACLPTCVEAGRPAAYAPIAAGAYLRSRLDATYPAPRGPS